MWSHDHDDPAAKTVKNGLLKSNDEYRSQNNKRPVSVKYIRQLKIATIINIAWCIPGNMLKWRSNYQNATAHMGVDINKRANQSIANVPPCTTAHLRLSTNFTYVCLHLIRQ